MECGKTKMKHTAHTIHNGSNQEEMIAVRVPASSANFGSGFDCCGLALQLYLTVRAGKLSTQADDGFVDIGRSDQHSKNLICEAMNFLARKEGLSLPVVQLSSRNEIPFASGLGSSGAAIVAGMLLACGIAGRKLSIDKLLRYATEVEGHADNVATALLGGFVVHCINGDGSVFAVKKQWPGDLEIIVVTPHFELKTNRARTVLPASIKRVDAIYNMQRLALFNAAIDKHEYDLLWEAMQDRLHQPYRRDLVPGLSEALATPRANGLLGIALSGAGPSVIALTNHQDSPVGETIATAFRSQGISTTIRRLGVDHKGATLLECGGVAPLWSA